MNKKNENENLNKTNSIIDKITIYERKTTNIQNKEDINNIRQSKTNKDFSKIINNSKNIENNQQIIKSEDSNINSHLSLQQRLNNKKIIEKNLINEKNLKIKEEEKSERSQIYTNSNKKIENNKEKNNNQIVVENNLKIDKKEIKKNEIKKVDKEKDNKDNIKNEHYNNDKNKISEILKLYNNKILEKEDNNLKNKKDNIKYEKKLDKNLFENKKIIKQEKDLNLDSNESKENLSFSNKNTDGKNKIMIDDNKGINSQIQEDKEDNCKKNDKKQKEIEKNEENNIKRKVTFYSKKIEQNNKNNQIYCDNNKNQFQNPIKNENFIPSNNSVNSVSQKIKDIQQRILKQKQNTEKIKKENVSKNILDNQNKNQENINLNENLDNKQQENHQIESSNKRKFENNINIYENNNNSNIIIKNNISKQNNNENFNSKSKEINLDKLNSNELVENTKEIKKLNNDGMCVSKFPKKLNLSLIFKNMNIDQSGTKINADSKKEILEVVQHNKEEQNEIEVNKKQEEMDNEIDNDEKENDEEEEIEEKDKQAGISNEIDKREEELEEINTDNMFSNELNDQEEKPEEKDINKNIVKNNNKDGNQSIKENKNIEIEKSDKGNDMLKRKTTINNNMQQIKTLLKMRLQGLDKKNNLEIKENKIENISENKNNEKKQNFEINNLNNNYNEDNNNSNEINPNLNKENEMKSSLNSEFKQNLQEEISDIPEKFNKSVSFNQQNNKDINSNIKKEYLNRPREMRNTLFIPSSKAKSAFNIANNSFEIIDNEEEIFLEKLSVENNINLKNNTFCESFFLSSIPKNDGKMMDNSDDQSECNHFICSLLPAMQPEIIYKYPKEDIKGLEINNLAASICFPNGIKLCYEEEENSIKTDKNYRSSFTNQIGERFFAVIYHFYLKMKNSEFESNYNVTPIKNQLLIYEEEQCTSLSDEPEEDIIKKLNKYDSLSSKENVYVPYCLCLISKYPYFEQMEKCLESIMITINNNENPKDLNKLITYIVKSIPSPPNESKVFFPLPYNNKLVEIQQPYFRDITEFGDNPLIILINLSEKHILYLFKLLIFEQKILITGQNNDLISQIILNFVSLLYPFEWIHTFIPIMSEKMLKFLQAFLPFFNGINESLYPKAKIILQKASNGVFIFNIDNHKIEINNNFKENSKHIKASSYINKNFSKFPKHLENLLLKELKEIKENHLKAKKDYDKYNANLRIKFLFIYVLVELLEDYKKYSYVIDDFPVFNSYLLVKDKKNDKKFFKDFTATQLFQMFIQNSLFRDGNKMTYFEECLNYYYELKKRGCSSNYNYSNAYKKFSKEYLSFFQIKTNYIIKPYFLKEYEKFEEEKIKKNKAIKLSNISNLLFNKYEQQNKINLNFHGILKENKRIMQRPIELTNDNDPKYYDIFILPGQTLENLQTNKKKENSKGDSALKKAKTIKIGIISEESDNNKNNMKISQCASSNEKDLLEDEKDEIKDNIREIMTRIYRSDLRKLEQDKKNIMNSLEHQFGREYFVNILNIGNIANRIDRNVVEGSYDFFSHVIFNTLLNILKLEENEINLICAMKLLKACLYIKTIKNKKEITLSNELYFQLEKYSIFNNKKFWIYWIEDDMTESDIEILKSTKKLNSNSDYFYIDEEDEKYQLYLNHSYRIIEGLTKIMIKMKLKNSFIYSIISELSQEYIIKDKDFQKLMYEVLNELHFYKHISK